MLLPDAIRDNYLFKGLDSSQIDAILALASEKSYNGGDVIFRQYDKADEMMLILSGSVKIKSFHGDELAEFGPGNVIGEVSLVDKEPRSANAVAVGHTRTACITARDLRALVEGDATMKGCIMENLCQTLCTRLRRANEVLDGALTHLG